MCTDKPFIKPPKSKTYGWMPNSPLLRRMMQSNISILMINWVFQGMRGMQSKELSFRVLFELFMVFLFYFIFARYYAASLLGAVTISIILAHSINWVFNTHVWVCVRYFKIYRRNPDSLRRFLNIISKELNSLSWIDSAVCIGSVGDKGDVMSWRADIDLRLFFKPGLINYIKTNVYLLYLRTKALVLVIPLDLYAYNDISYLDNFRKDEGLMLIKDVGKKIENLYPEKVGSSQI